MNDLLLTAAQMRALEAAAIDSGSVTGLDLMERAGRGAVAAIEAEWPELAATPGRAVVLCGPGNNGGDGFVVARLLAEKGWTVKVFLYGDADKLPPDARANYARWREMGEVRILTDTAMDGYCEDHPTTTLCIDAIFGSGLSRPFFDLGRVQMELNFWQADETMAKVVSLDVPSGLSSDTGTYPGHEDGAENPLDVGVLANLTVTFHSLFLGHVLADGPAACGKIRVVPIGLQDKGDKAATARLVGGTAAGTAKHDGHKYDHGHALVLTGGFARTGAARLAARAALRIGAGLVTVAAPGAALMECVAQLTAIMLRRCDGAAALEALLEDDRLNALCLGPGLGTDARAAGLVAAALAACRATVLDADALTLIAGDAALRGKLHDRCVLTPHGGEFARLFPDISARMMAPATSGPAFSKVDAAREAAAQAGCTVLLKGPDTVIADPSGRASVNAAVYDRAAPWLATAGAGDVLSGMIAGLMARGLPPHDAAASAAWLHVEAARTFGPGLIAEDLPEALPAVLRGVEA